MIVWRGYLVLWGGFFSQSNEIRFFNDLYTYEFSSNTWTKHEYSHLAQVPMPRSAFNFALGTADVAVMSGGYVKIKNSNPGSVQESKTFTDSWTINLKPVLEGKPPTWERMTKKGMWPSARSGAGCCSHKGRLLIFGGVSDKELADHRMNSEFYNDMYGCDIEKRVWFKVNIGDREVDCVAGGAQAEQGQEEGQEGEGEDGQVEGNGEVETDLEQDSPPLPSKGFTSSELREGLFTYLDAEGNVVYEKGRGNDGGRSKDNSGITEDDVKVSIDLDEIKAYANHAGSSSDEEEEEEKDDGKRNGGDVDIDVPLSGKGGANSNVCAIVDESIDVLKSSQNAIESLRRPMARIKATIACMNNFVYVYGGVVEVGQREVTLDDFWRVNITDRKKKWECLYQGNMNRQVWKGEEGSDAESYVSGSGGRNDLDSDSDYDDDDDGEGDEGDGNADKDAPQEILVGNVAVPKPNPKQTLKIYYDENKDIFKKVAIEQSEQSAVEGVDDKALYGMAFKACRDFYSEHVQGKR